MKNTKIAYLILLGIVVVLGVFALMRHYTTQAAYREFLKTYHLKETDIVYAAKEKPFGGQGMILYQVSFPLFKVAHQIDKLIVRQAGSQLIIQMSGLNVNVPQTLKAVYGNRFVAELDAYRPFEDALARPFISLGLMGVRQVKADVVIVLDPTSVPMPITAKIMIPKLGDIQLSFSLVPVPDRSYKRSLLSVGYGIVPQVNVLIQDAGFFRLYARYLNRLGLNEAASYAKDLMRNTTYAERFEGRTVTIQNGVGAEPMTGFDLRSFYR